jgi:hypothetical protein
MKSLHTKNVFFITYFVLQNHPPVLKLLILEQAKSYIQ